MMEKLLAQNVDCPLSDATRSVLLKSSVARTLLQEAESAISESLPTHAPAGAAAKQCMKHLLGHARLVEYQIPGHDPPSSGVPSSSQ